MTAPEDGPAAPQPCNDMMWRDDDEGGPDILCDLPSGHGGPHNRTTGRLPNGRVSGYAWGHLAPQPDSGPEMPGHHRFESPSAASGASVEEARLAAVRRINDNARPYFFTYEAALRAEWDAERARLRTALEHITRLVNTDDAVVIAARALAGEETQSG